MGHHAVRSASIMIVIAGMLAGSASAIELGDPAPEIQVADWIKGEPVELAKGKGKNIFVIEFWATWCGPCVKSIPHLTELQKEYRDKGVVVIGISDESASVVKPFVEKTGDEMGYTVAIDKREATGRRYMAAFGIDGIPHAFVVDKSGAIAWHGHPLSGLDRVLERMVNGKYDIKQAKQEAAAAKLLGEYAEQLVRLNAAVDDKEKATQQARIKKLGETLLETGSTSAGVLNEFASLILLMPDLDYRDLEQARRAIEAAYEASDKAPADKAHKAILEHYRSVRAANPEKPADEQTQRKTAENAKTILENAGPDELNEFAWTVMMRPGLEPRDLKLALAAADKARTETKDENAAILDTYARALFMTGRRDKAIEYQRKAIETNEDRQLEPLLKEVLAEYEKAPAGQTQK